MIKKRVFTSILLLAVIFLGSLQSPTINALDNKKPTVTRGPIEKNVMVLVYYGGHDPNYSYDYNSLLPQIESEIEGVSHFRDYDGTNTNAFQNVDYKIVSKIIENTPPPQVGDTEGENCVQYLPLVWSNQWTQSNWESTHCWGSATLDFQSILSQYNLCSLYNNGSFDELWLMGFSNAGFAESGEAGPTASDINYRDLTCLSNFSFMGFNYQASVTQALHSFAHKMETAMLENLGFDFFEKFTGYRRQDYNKIPDVLTNKCGHVHLAPNSYEPYLYSSTEYSYSDCENWIPDGIGELQLINCEQWGCTGLGYFRWWLKSVPGYNNGILFADQSEVPNIWGYFANANGYDPNVNLKAMFTSNLPKGPVNNYVVVDFNSREVSEGNPTVWLWDFGDGHSSRKENPRHKFSIGTYTVSLKIKDQYGNTSTYVYPDFVTVDPSWGK